MNCMTANPHDRYFNQIKINLDTMMHREEEYVLKTELGQDTLCSCVIKLKDELHAFR